MPNTHVPAAGEAMPAANVSRRLALLGGLSAAAAFAAVPKAQASLPLTPDERIAAAIEEIKAAFWEKWPDAPLRVIDIDNIRDGMVIVLSHVSTDKPGEVVYQRKGLAREGGVS
ncbi:hypothetical protein EJ076_18520 [Mesorhizobium sp. M7D.F.Ca.US.005.01.1.1]|uniref:hypothetical protein n=1 Tax=Mesorhizobium sp. M7D.F.Ca.US.005.01.1.1 TaxID=2493678 RepID=UPI000F754100|nr:hypothetical protein [Mesorhizobium sp. M7D.F.Ca.US.005.01.1.1]AZO42949.1 hypothetical protein EJ076_18520 [Mesorhizobium sp. M7D.F.Ca.US.005.01.1.1]